MGDSGGKLREFYDGVCQGAKATAKRLQKSGGAGAKYGHPDLKIWRGYASLLGVSNNLFPQSVQAMWKRILTGNMFHINPLVNFYNALSIKHVITGGGFDLEDLPGDVILRLSMDSDTFLALDAGKGARPLSVQPDEVSYVVEGVDEASGNVLTRHLAYKQSKTGLIVQKSTDIFLTFEMPPDLVDRVAPALITDLKALPGMYDEGSEAKVFVQVLNRRSPKAYF